MSTEILHLPKTTIEVNLIGAKGGNGTKGFGGQVRGGSGVSAPTGGGFAGGSAVGSTSGAQPYVMAAACGNALSLRDFIGPVATMELPGFGGSKIKSMDDAGFGLADYVSAFDGVARQKAAGSGKTVLFAYSHAGFFAVKYALANQEALGGLILVEPALWVDRGHLIHLAELAEAGNAEGAITTLFSRIMPKLMLDPVALQNAAQNVVSHAQSGETIALEYRVRAENPVSEDEIANLKIPVLLIGGTKSTARSQVEKTARILPYAQVWWVKDADHFDLTLEKTAEEISAVVNLFVSKHCT